MPRREPTPLIDTSRDGSLSFAPPDPPATPALNSNQAIRRPVAVGPGRTAITAPTFGGGASRDDVSGYPIQPGKVQRPPLRDDTLARHRLLDWLDVKIHNRVVFVIADAGYGKTTLLADFSRRTRLRTLWYRMDEEDRDWVAFLSHLVAAGREHDPGFAPSSQQMLKEGDPAGPSRDEVLEVFIRELAAICVNGATLILDDYHLGEQAPDVRHVVQELVSRAPERLSIVFSSRRVPALRVARLRSRGELAELGTGDLRFSQTETAELFSDTYRRPLDSDVLNDLTQRTEGWAASLHLVQTALRDRSSSEVRAFVRGLTGAQEELYDYLAEEVVGDLPLDQQRFLMTTSILQIIEPEQAQVVTGQGPGVVSRLIAESERIGLISRRHERPRVGYRYHPLVREFLEARLRRDIGDMAVRQLHLSVARWAEAIDWRASCFHYAAAREPEHVHRILNASIENIVGAGEFALAADYLERFAPTERMAGFEVIRSRVAARTVDVGAAIAHARLAVSLDPTSESSLSNLLSTYFLAGQLGEASALAAQLAETAQSPVLRDVGAATWQVLAVSLHGHTSDALRALNHLALASRDRGHAHYEGVALVNAAAVHRAIGDAQSALECASSAVEALGQSSRGSEILTAQLTQAWALAHLGRLEDARATLALALESCTAASRSEWLLEAAGIETSYGDEQAARSLLDELEILDLSPSFVAIVELTRAQFAIRTRNRLDAATHLQPVDWREPTQEPGHLARRTALAAHLSVLAGASDGTKQLAIALALAQRQGASFWASYCQVLSACPPIGTGEAIARLMPSDTVYLSHVAESVIDGLSLMDATSLAAVTAEARLRPDRWRTSLRHVVNDDRNTTRIHAARILDQVGTADDVALLRSVARSTKLVGTDGSLGRGLARRLAPRVFVEDQGRVEIRIGSEIVPGTDLRRKVLALLCFLLARPKYSATRDEVVEALWPDMVPEIAGNSLNQTVYFLRRVFEPGYKEDTSAGYVRHESDLIWLDPELIRSRSRVCADLINSLGTDPSPDEVLTLSDTYKGRFALDFMYEEWAVPYRDNVHVSYLQIVESAVNRDIESGHHGRGIRLAKRALDIDPEVESLELSLLRLYRVTGAHAAAAEQYEHYSAYLRDDLGIDPPPLSSL